MGELTKLNNAGKQSPGPIYNYQDEIKYNKVVAVVVYDVLGSNMGIRNSRENGRNQA